MERRMLNDIKKTACIAGVAVSPPVVLAPMAGAADMAFRTICRPMGAGLTYSEMISAKALCYGDKKTARLLGRGANETPFAVQIFGCDPDTMARAAVLACRMSGADIIDINLGCPAPKIVSNGEGSALLKDHALAGDIIRAVVAASPVPVTVKARLGWDTPCAVEFALMAEAAGAAAICLHGRTRAQMFSGAVDRDMIRQVKQAIKIPLIANGDIKSGADALAMLSDTGADMVMIGRGALGNPFVFRRCAQALAGLPETEAALDEKMDVLTRQAALTIRQKGEHTAIREMRKHFAWYVSGVRGAARYRAAAGGIKTYGDLERLAKEVVDSR